MELIKSATKSVKFYDPKAKRSFIVPLNFFAPSEDILNYGEHLTDQDIEMNWFVLVLKNGAKRRVCRNDFESIMNELEDYEDELEAKKAALSWGEIANHFSELAKTFAAMV